MLRTVLAALVGGSLLTSLPAAAVTIDVALFHTERDTFAEAYKWWADEVAKRTDNRVQFKAHYSGSLLPLGEVFNGVRNGVIPAGVVAPSVVSGQIPAMGYIEAIGGLPSDPATQAASLDKLQGHIEGLFRQSGVEYIWMQPSAGAAAACTGKHLKSAADWKGIKIRSAGRWQGAQMQQFGASPTSIDPGEIYLALQNKTVDCSLTVNNLALSLKLYEVAPKLTQFDMPVNAVIYIFNKDVWSKISEADRQTIKAASKEATIRAATIVYTAQEEAAKKIKELGGDLYKLNPAEQAAFRKAMEPVFDKIGEASGANGKPIADVLKPHW
jgi:TRAP-type C4-dicarboxylate transport system substrate-binding protein